MKFIAYCHYLGRDVNKLHGVRWQWRVVHHVVPGTFGLNSKALLEGNEPARIGHLLLVSYSPLLIRNVHRCKRMHQIMIQPFFLSQHLHWVLQKRP